MQTKKVIYILALSFFCGMAFGDEVMLTTNEFKLDFQLQSFQWKKTLSETEKQKVISALASEKEPIVDSALKVAAIHEIKEAVPTIRKGINVSDIELNLFATLTADAITSNKSLHKQMKTTIFPKEAGAEDIEKVKDDIIWVEVVKETKSHRSGVKTTTRLKGLKLSKLENKLLNKANKKNDAAINEIIDSLSKAEIAGADEYDLRCILRTYEPNSVTAVIQKLSNENQVKDMSVYGKIELLRFLQISSYTMPEEDRQRCKKIFEHFLTEDNPDISREAFGDLETVKQLEALEISEKQE